MELFTLLKHFQVCMPLQISSGNVAMSYQNREMQVTECGKSVVSYIAHPVQGQTSVKIYNRILCIMKDGCQPTLYQQSKNSSWRRKPRDLCLPAQHGTPSSLQLWINSCGSHCWQCTAASAVCADSVMVVCNMYQGRGTILLPSVSK